MAILSDIRKKPLILIAIIGMALFAFVLDPSSLSDFFNSSKVNSIGNINGENISREEFVEALDAYKAQAGSSISEMQASKTVWDNLVRQKIYKAELEKAGITIGEEDILNVLCNANSVQNDPKFQSGGFFDKAKLKEYLANLRDDESQKTVWKSWQSYMTSIKESLQRTTYDNLVTVGLGASLKEGEAQYFNDNTKLSAKYVYVPYTSISDSLVKLTKGDIKSYISKHEDDFKVEASRDIRFVKFNITATPEDEEELKKEVAKLLEDREEYSPVTKGNVTLNGLKTATNITEFLEENKSDSPYNDSFQFENNLPKEIAAQLLAGEKGAVFGPYKEQGFFKISKIVEVTQLPDSVKASHILIPFIGSRTATAETTQTEEQAQKTADSLATVLKRNKSKFSELAKELSEDRGSAEKGGDLGWFTYNRMVPEFRDYSFENKKGDIGVVKSQFGFHIIKIDDQKAKKKAIKLATFSRKIEPSEATENIIFEKAETFALALTNGKKFDDVAKENELKGSAAVGLKVLDENVPGLGNQRDIVSWAFDKDLEIGSSKRFDIEDGHVVVVLTAKQEKGLMSVEKATAKVRPILLNEKKASLITAKINGATLGDIAKENKGSVRTVSQVNLKSPTISGVGFEPKVVGAMLNAKENELYKNIEGNKGVFSFVVTAKELPTALPNYAPYREQIANKRKNQSFKIIEAVKNASEIEDNRAFFYGIQ